MHDGPREAFPGDLKKQECMYNIVQAQDGGLVICGNNSRNFDDNYLVKLHDDCGFTAGVDYDINPLAEEEAENELKKKMPAKAITGEQADELAAWHDLLEKGIISKSEYEEKRKIILGLD